MTISSEKLQVIGILGGTFDPIHLGHLRMAIELQAELQLNSMHLVPCYQPVHKNSTIASPKHRLNMIKLAIQHERTLIADPREINHPYPNYTIDTLREFRQEFPAASLCLCVGIDAFLNIASWKDYHEYLSLAHIVIADRPPYQLPTPASISKLFHQDIQTKPDFIHRQLSGGLLRIQITALEISASDIRKQIAMGQNPRYLLPEGVYDYIRENHIYEA